MKVMVTGGAGFIGNHVLRELLGYGYEVVNVDSLTQAASLSSIWDLQEEPGYTLENHDIGDTAAMADIFRTHQPASVLHLAAETDITRSLAAPSETMSTNVMGTFRLLETARHYWESKGAPSDFRFLMASSANVFGERTSEDAIPDTEAHAPRDPHGASIAAAEHLTRAWHMSFGFPVLTCRGTNTYGPRQSADALIPLTIARALAREPIPFDTTSSATLEWLHVSDHARALTSALHFGRPGSLYNIGADTEMCGSDLMRALCRLLQVKRPAEFAYTSLLEQVDRTSSSTPSLRLDDRKFREEIGWAPEISFNQGLSETLNWCLENNSWLQSQRNKISENAQAGDAERRFAGGFGG